MTEENQYDAVIIGAGVIGAAVAFELAQRGWKTCSVDKLPAAGYGSTSNSCAIVRFSYSTYQGVAMAYEGMHYWADWSNYLGGPGVDESGLVAFHQTGTVMIGAPGGHHEKVVPLLESLNIPHEHWSVEKLQERLPLLTDGVFGPTARPDDDDFWVEPTERIIGALYTPDSGYVSDPQLLTHNLQRAAEAKGSTFVFNRQVVAINQEGGRVSGVELDDGTQIAAPVVVNVAGPHSYLVNDLAGLAGTMNIGTKALRHEVHHVPSPEGFNFETDGMHVSDGDSAVYFRPETGNNILIGSEDPECDVKEWVDPDNYDQEIQQEQWEAQVLRCAKRVEGLGLPHEKKGVVDLYDVSDDWIPIYDRTDLDGFYIAIGTSGNQYKNAGVAGHCMAELIMAVEAGHDHDAEPLKVKGRYTGVEMDLGFFSRNREINPDSSFSVNG